MSHLEVTCGIVHLETTTNCTTTGGFLPLSIGWPEMRLLVNGTRLAPQEAFPPISARVIEAD